MGSPVEEADLVRFCQQVFRTVLGQSVIQGDAPKAERWAVVEIMGAWNGMVYLGFDDENTTKVAVEIRVIFLFQDI